MVIFAPATEAPCESVTVPAMRPKMLWAAAGLTTQVVNKTVNINAAVFNANPGSLPPQTSWFDLDSFPTRTPPSKKNSHVFRLFLLADLFFRPPRFNAAPEGNLGWSV